MNTTKNNIEHHIKKQISEREITPSRNLWSEIEAQSERKSSKTKMNWYLVAACLVLTFSLGAVLFFNKENKEVGKSEMAAEIKNSDIQNKTQEQTVQSPKNLDQKQKESFIAENIQAEKKNEAVKSQIIVEQKQMPLTKENAPEIIANISKTEPEEIIAKSDSVKTQGKRKRYVDPSTLLFSVEHKDVIEKTKESNVATIDLNGK
ncbi:hypothetical protein QX233_07575 [Chryseobacterium gambrini]|uniref:Uncharacterized protein n=1 Tax=Chryseobacterium gambrini TaxID=373672 RepID=A0AAJ1R1T2_9FLAO|nr:MULTISPECIES: hypothetical protein [Chryseobacterium]MDN4012311.1 hypothetical protein [Chryseobacterium gambrini]MDN4030519.1 hypothetical protein [Chryseobacterium gambrini]QWA36820.1 hypothetical protein KKI44_12800 [Chryseobacterium sp. ZHDP1]